MKEKKSKKTPTILIHLLLFKKRFLKKERLKAADAGRKFLIPPFPLPFALIRKDVKKTIIVFRPRKCINPHFFPQSFSFFFPSQILSST